MTIGEQISTLRKRKKWSQTKLAEISSTSREAIGKYERGEVTPSVEVAKRLAILFEVSLDYLVGEGQNSNFDKNTLARLEQIERLPEDEKKTLFTVLDALLRDFKAKQAYS
jgi:transcriptional regulator with XRE-family HTH domain